MLQSLPLQQFHDDEPRVLILAHFVDTTDVRMIQGWSIAPRTCGGACDYSSLAE